MEDGHEPAPVHLCPLPAQFGNPHAGFAEEGFAGDVAGKQDDFGVHDADDLEQERFVVFDFLGGRFAEGFAIFTGREAKNGVGDEEVFVGVPSSGGENLIEQLPCPSDKGFALDIFLRAGGFTDEHEFGGWVAPADDDVGSRVGEGVVGHGVHVFEQIVEVGFGAGGFAEEVKLHGRLLF